MPECPPPCVIVCCGYGAAWPMWLEGNAPGASNGLSLYSCPAPAAKIIGILWLPCVWTPAWTLTPTNFSGAKNDRRFCLAPGSTHRVIFRRGNNSPGLSRRGKNSPSFCRAGIKSRPVFSGTEQLAELCPARKQKTRRFSGAETKLAEFVQRRDKNSPSFFRSRKNSASFFPARGNVD